MESKRKSDLDETAVEKFKSYLRIPSVQPNVDYSECVDFLEAYAKELSIPARIIQFSDKKPIVLMTWNGTEPNQSAILLNSHMDVVPVTPETWNHDPFGAEEDTNGYIFARGTQDMKSVGIQYLEAIRRLILNGKRLKRTIHISFVPDEETGGREGMKLFAKSEEFKKLNIGCGFDEGTANPTSEFIVFYAERTVREFDVVINGTEGHAMLLLKSTAGEKLRKLLDRFYDYRQTQVDLLQQNSKLTEGDVTSLNVTITKGGTEVNVLPSNFIVTVDMRVAIDVDLDELERSLQSWADESGENVQIIYTSKDDRIEPTKLDDSNPYWVAMKKRSDELGIKLKPAVLPGATDSRYIRQLGIPVINISPMNNMTPLPHANDESLNRNVFLSGIEYYQNLLEAVANI